MRTRWSEEFNNGYWIPLLCPLNGHVKFFPVNTYFKILQLLMGSLEVVNNFHSFDVHREISVTTPISYLLIHKPKIPGS